jgi:hypothetical protein
MNKTIQSATRMKVKKYVSDFAEKINFLNGDYERIIRMAGSSIDSIRIQYELENEAHTAKALVMKSLNEDILPCMNNFLDMFDQMEKVGEIHIKTLLNLSKKEEEILDIDVLKNTKIYEKFLAAKKQLPNSKEEFKEKLHLNPKDMLVKLDNTIEIYARFLEENMYLKEILELAQKQKILREEGNNLGFDFDFAEANGRKDFSDYITMNYEKASNNILSLYEAGIEEEVFDNYESRFDIGDGVKFTSADEAVGLACGEDYIKFCKNDKKVALECNGVRITMLDQGKTLIGKTDDVGYIINFSDDNTFEFKEGSMENFQKVGLHLNTNMLSMSKTLDKKNTIIDNHIL